MASQQLTDQLVKHIDEALGMEQNVLRMLDGMIQTTDDPEIKRELQQHKLETQQHADRMEKRLQAHDASPSIVKEAGGIVGALMKGVLDMTRPEKAGRNARDASNTTAVASKTCSMESTNSTVSNALLATAAASASHTR